jgi:hypothetical protein
METGPERSLANELDVASGKIESCSWSMEVVSRREPPVSSLRDFCL